MKSIKSLQLTGAAILVSRSMKVTQTAPARELGVRYLHGRLDGPDVALVTIEHRLGKVNTFHFLRALSYIGLILAGVSTGDHGKCE
jgi:hypothetical protein